MTVIYLVRHGQASFSADDYDQLSDKGIEQAIELGKYLKAKLQQPSKIISGNMLRHQQTLTNSIQAFENKDDIAESAEVDKRWNEYDHQNILAAFNEELATPQGIKQFLIKEEKPFDYVKQLFIKAIGKWTAEPNDDERYSESFNDFSQRIIDALEQVAADNKDGNIIIYTSGGPISIVVCYLLGIPFNRFLDINWSLVNGGITKIMTRGKQRKLVLSTLNEHDVFEQQAERKLITYT